MAGPTLQWPERLYYRDRLRAGRYAALADAEGFLNICFALEALGMRLLGKKCDLGKYKEPIKQLSRDSVVLSDISLTIPHLFGKFDALYDFVRQARNDAMHSGAYARHATAAAIELCIGLEEALMKEQQHPRKAVADFMVKFPITAHSWSPVAHARQLMLTHSFSYIPVMLNEWMLISELAIARYLRRDGAWGEMLAANIEDAVNNGLALIPATVVTLNENVSDLLNRVEQNGSPALWLVQDDNQNLCGVLSPFELM
jgi:hypothetical protein